MRKYTTKLILILLLSSLVIPIFPVIAQPTTAQVPSFIIGTTGGEMGSWDGIVATAGFAGSDYAPNAMEPLWVEPDGWSGDHDEMVPVLAESWTITKWPPEMNVNPEPFMNMDGIRAIEFTLRDDVTFHDGSNFNATVAKWNIDRMMVQSGNITGGLTAGNLGESDWYKSRTSYWMPADVWSPFETATWNVSQFSDQFATYDGFGTSDAWWSYGHYPRIRNVTITENLASGGKIKVYYNDWSGILTYVDTMMISMDAYQDYFDEPIVGSGDAPGFPQPDVSGGYPTTGFRGHMIGTGPYRFIEHDEIVLQGGIMERYDDWWNASAMEANGMFQAPKLDIVTFGYDTSGIAGRNLAMATGTIDIAYDSIGVGGLNYIDMIADPNINYVLTGTEPTRTYISLNCVNETYWKDWADMALDAINLTAWNGIAGDLGPWLPFLNPDIEGDGTIHVDGIDATMRKAVSYAFNYDTYINVILGGRAVRSGGFLPTTNVHYNPAIPLPYNNLTIARQALLDDPVWNATLFARGLTVANLTDDDAWLDVAVNDPIFIFKLAWDQANLDISNVFATSINSIGMRLGGPFGAPDDAWEVVPDFYTAIYSDFSFNSFTYHGIPTNWPGMDIRATPSLEYYYHSPQLPYVWGSGALYPFEQLYNINFVYNETVDKWLDMTWFSNFTYTQELMDKLTTHFQTIQFSDIMVAESMTGYAINKDWEFPAGALGFSFLKYLPEQDEDGGTQIPGFETAIILAIGIIAMTGIGYSLKRKRKLA